MGNLSIVSDQPKSGKVLRRGSAPISGNGEGRLHAPILALGSITQEERRNYLKYALFCLTIAALLIIGNQLGKKAPTTIGQSASRLNVRFDLSFEQAQGKPAGEGSQSEPGARLVTFRLSNRGNNSVYYAVHPGTNVVIGHLVYRRAVLSEWMALPGPPKSAVTSQPIDRNVAWIEMPPGGWIDGQFEDPGWPGGDHAYVVELKSERDAKVVNMVSPPYRFTAN
jgi:hypothetical protein